MTGQRSATEKNLSPPLAITGRQSQLGYAVACKEEIYNAKGHVHIGRGDPPFGKAMG
jgi:hypothetical protein